MSSSNPPYPYFNGIPFNPSFFTSTTSTSSGLTEADANTKYLQKFTPDTATALETFSGGVTVSGTTQINLSGSQGTSIGNSSSSGTTIVGSTNINISGTGSSMTSLGNSTSIVQIQSGITRICNFAPPDNLRTIDIGATDGLFDTTTTISGKTTINKLATNTISGTAIDSTQKIGSNITTGSITIGEALTGGLALGKVGGGSITVNGTLKANTIEPIATTDAITIGNTTTAGVNLATGALSSTGYVSIASSASNNPSSYMNLGSDSLGTIYFRSRTVDINGNGAGNTSIGSTTGTGTITLYKPITIGYNVPTLNTQLGYTISSYIGNKILAANNGGANQTITSFTLPVGTWICSYQIRYYSESTTTMTQSKAIMSIATPPADWGNNFGFQQNNISQTITTGANMMVSSSSTIYNTTSQTLYLYDASTYSTTTGNFYAIGAPKDTYLIATRIA